MTPKEKAKQLHILFSNAIPSSKAEWYESKQCALIAVDEIIDELTSRGILSGFWYEVHEEIKKL